MTGNPTRASALLLTGPPGVGKTTVLRTVADALPDGIGRGFLTEEIRRHGRRVGFRIKTLDGGMATLAHQDLDSPYRVGRYRVDLVALDRIVASTLCGESSSRFVLLDEIGKMECLSKPFVNAVRAILDSGQTLVATVGLHGSGFMADVKRRPGVEVRTLTTRTRDSEPARILEWLRQDHHPQNDRAQLSRHL